MTMSDPIADMLTRIRNANTAKHDTVDIPASKMKIAIADILVDEGYISKYDIVEDGNFKSIRVTLKYGADKKTRTSTAVKQQAPQACVSTNSTMTAHDFLKYQITKKKTRRFFAFQISV